MHLFAKDESPFLFDNGLVISSDKVRRSKTFYLNIQIVLELIQLLD